jgi:citronellol/citronellal dehydrogenase
VINTAALALLPGVDPALCRTPEIVADAAHALLLRDGRQHTGNFYIDEELLEGGANLDRYAVVPGTTRFLPDLFLD